MDSTKIHTYTEYLVIDYMQTTIRPRMPVVSSIYFSIERRLLCFGKNFNRNDRHTDQT